MGASDLQALRQQIDALDLELLSLLNERARLAQQVGRAKQDSAGAVFVPDREAAVLERLREANQGPLRLEHLQAIYREVLSSCRSLQRPIRVAYLGPAATFTHQAALARFGQSSLFTPVTGIAEVFLQVQKGEADYGVVPVENSTEGPVHETLDQLVDSELRVCSAVTLPITHCLLSNAPMDRVRTVYSNPQAFAQCRRWLAQNLPSCELAPTVTTAKAAETAAADPSGAAIATELAALEYGLQVVRSGIQDLAHNFTRFFVIGHSMSQRQTGRNRTALLFTIKDRVGALRDVVEVFAGNGINLSSIQSRPSKRRAWDYIFFVELEGHPNQAKVKRALQQVEQHCVFLKTLGAWPQEPSP